MGVKIFEQNTCESCLSVCLMALLESQRGIKLDAEEEYKILFEGIKFTKLDFSTGHLVYLAKKFPNIAIEQYIDFPRFHKILSQLELPGNVRLISQKIDLPLLKKLLGEGPVIVYIDMFTIEKLYHYSHFVILSEIDGDKAIIYDPWSGKEIVMCTKDLTKSISHIRNNLKISPKVIRIL